VTQGYVRNRIVRGHECSLFPGLARTILAEMRERRIEVAPPKDREHASTGLRMWRKELVRQAVSAQCTGDFFSTSQLAASMMADPAYSAAINRRVDGLIRTPLSPPAKLSPTSTGFTGDR
jgi:hypothetical protein